MLIRLGVSFYGIMFEKIVFYPGFLEKKKKSSKNALN
jgi:hypothetical protein